MRPQKSTWEEDAGIFANNSQIIFFIPDKNPELYYLNNLFKIGLEVVFMVMAKIV